MMILRECVRRHGQLPQIVVIDGGPEFQSTYFEALLARYECIKKAILYITQARAAHPLGPRLDRALDSYSTTKNCSYLPSGIT